ncbi:hypothetical protein ACP3V9_24980, partial [Salmonella enterica]
GVIAEIARVFADHHVSIEAMRQPGIVSVDGEVDTEQDNGAVLQVVTHPAQEKSLAQTVATLKALDVVRAVTSVLRVEIEQ